MNDKINPQGSIIDSFFSIGIYITVLQHVLKYSDLIFENLKFKSKNQNDLDIFG